MGTYGFISDFSVVPTYCIMTMDYTISPVPNPTSAIIVNLVSKTVTIFSNNSTFGISGNSTPVTYTVTIFQVTEGGID